LQQWTYTAPHGNRTMSCFWAPTGRSHFPDELEFYLSTSYLIESILERLVIKKKLVLKVHINLVIFAIAWGPTFRA